MFVPNKKAFGNETQRTGITNYVVGERKAKLSHLPRNEKGLATLNYSKIT